MIKIILLIASLLIPSMAYPAASIVPAFGTFSSATGGKVSSGQTGTNTLNVVGGTVSKIGTRPTLTIPAIPSASVTAVSAIAGASVDTPLSDSFFGYLDGATYKKLSYIDLRSDLRGMVYDVRDYASLAAAVAAIGSTPATLQYSADQTLAANLVVPATLELMPLNGAVINHGAYTISYAGSTARWPLAQVLNGTGAVTFGKNASVNVEWFGIGAAAMQAAINSGVALNGLNSGYVTVNVSTDQTWESAINLTSRDRVHIKFKRGVFATSTSPDYIFDCTSMGYSTMENVEVTSSTARVGIYLNRGTIRPSAEFNVFKNCQISLTSDTAANSGVGTIGIYNSRAELLTVENCRFYADLPAVLEMKTRAYLMPVYATIQAAGTGWDSATVMTFSDCMFNASGTFAPAVYIDNVLGLECNNCYWRHGTTSTGTNNYAIITNNLYRSKFSGSVEGYPQFLQTLRVAQYLDINIVIGAVTLNTLGVINVDSVSTDVGGIKYSKIVIQSTATSVEGACAVYGSRGAANTLIEGNDITSNLTAIITADTTLRLARKVLNNIETSTNGKIINNVLEYSRVGAYVDNGTSLAYTMPAGAGYVEITAAYGFIGGGSSDQQTVTVILTAWNGGEPKVILKSSGSNGTANRITYSLTGSVLTFTSSSSTGASFIRYQIKEVYGDKV